MTHPAYTPAHYLTNGYAAKRAIMRAIAARAAQPGNPLSDVQVLYKLRTSVMEKVCIYGGGFIFEQASGDGEDDLVDGPARLPFERLIVAVHIRMVVSPPDLDMEATDIAVELMGDEIAAMVARDPHLAGGKSSAYFVGGEGDYTPDDASDIVTLSTRIAVDSYVI